MKRLVVALIIVCTSLTTGAVRAMAEGKVALVSLQRALNEVEEGKRAKASLKADFDAKQKQLETMKTNLKTMKDNLDKQKMVLSEEALKTKSLEIQNKFMELQQTAGNYEQELKKKEAESTDKILNALRTAVIALAKSKGYETVFENSGDTVLYSTTAVDITNDLISSYNSGKR